MTDTDMGGPCACDWFDRPELYTSKIRKARKTHKCYECDRDIEPGQTYEYVTALQDGYWSEYKTHQACAGIRRDFCCNVHGSISETFEETYGFSPWSTVEQTRGE